MKIPKTMKAAILVEQKKPLIIDVIELPTSLDVGQVLVKVHYSGICGSQLGEIDGAKGPDKFLPHLLGHEASGKVVAIGPGVRHVKPDDSVVMHWRQSKGIEASPSQYKWKGKIVNAGLITTFNEYAIVSENRITVIPNESNMKIAALFGCAITTGFGVIQNNANVKIGQSVVVYGAGGVGLNIIQAAKIVGAYPIIAVDIFNNRLDLAKKFGATYVINSKESDAQGVIEKLIGENKLDHFIDNTGQPFNIELGYKITNSKGRVTLVGVPKKENNINIYSLKLHFGKSIIGSQGGESVPHEDIPRYFKLYNAKKIMLRELITDIEPIEKINEAISRMRTGEIAGRVLIKFN
jgi:Zn-dependent alcohol dehydrogenase